MVSIHSHQFYGHFRTVLACQCEQSIRHYTSVRLSHLQLCWQKQGSLDNVTRRTSTYLPYHPWTCYIPLNWKNKLASTPTYLTTHVIHAPTHMPCAHIHMHSTQLWIHSHTIYIQAHILLQYVLSYMLYHLRNGSLSYIYTRSTDLTFTQVKWYSWCDGGQYHCDYRQSISVNACNVLNNWELIDQVLLVGLQHPMVYTCHGRWMMNTLWFRPPSHKCHLMKCCCVYGTVSQQTLPLLGNVL